jgi:hypothetical protein
MPDRHWIISTTCDGIGSYSNHFKLRMAGNEKVERCA